MIRLRAFGGFDLELDRAGTRTPSIRPRVLALLALLCGHRARGIRRDKILAYLWPDSDTGHARNSLKQAVFSLRRTFGRSLVFSSGGVLRLDPSIVEADVWRFETALAEGRLADAVSLYCGPFLDGFYVSGLGEFERWAESERRRLALRYQEALEALAARSAAARDTHGAAMWWHRVVQHDPLSSRTALALMQALIADGDRAGALKYAELHESLLRAELGVDPDTGERKFVQQLRQFVSRHGHRRLRDRLRWKPRSIHGPGV